MATSRPISTISYNSFGFLKDRLDEWVEAHDIQAYQLIRHKGEAGDKDHIHLRIEPNKRLDPMDLSEQLKEFEKGKDKPLGVRPFRPSKEEDWILYALHDPDYMKMKYGEVPKNEKIPYDWKDIVVSPDYDVETMLVRAKAMMRRSASNLANKIREGEKPLNLILEGNSPTVVGAIQRILSDSELVTYIAMCRKAQETIFQYEKALLAVGMYFEENEDGVSYTVKVKE